MASGTKTVGPSKNYSSLNAWEAGEQDDLTDTGPAIAECYAFEDTSLVLIDGWTTTAADYIKIYTPTSERHDGKWNTAKFRLNRSDSGYALENNEDYLQVVGLQIKITQSSGYPACFRSGTFVDIRISDTILWVADSSTASGTAISVDNGTGRSLRVWNVIAYCTYGRTGDIGIDWRGYNGDGGSCNVYNCTISRFGTACRNYMGAYTATNALSSGNTNDRSGTITATYCATSNASGGNSWAAGTGNRYSQTFTFVNADGDDFHLASGDAGAKDYGVSDPGSGLFSDDVDSVTRTGTWDIGADEYVAVGGVGYPVLWGESSIILGGWVVR